MKLLLLHQGAIGDFVLTLSVVQALLEADPSAEHHVTTIASAPSAALAAGRSVITERLSPEAAGLHALFAEDGLCGERLSDLLIRAELVLSFLGDAADLPHRRLATRARRVVSVDPRPTQRTLERRGHITAQWAQAMRAVGLDVAEPSPPMIRRSAHSMASLDHEGLMIHPGSGGRGKCWPLERFFAVADAQVDRSVNWLIGPAEREPEAMMTALQARCARQPGERIVCEADLSAAAARITACGLFLGNDAGMTHLAAALGVPTVALFGPTDPAVWAPLGDHVRIVATDEPGEPMAGLPVERVLRAVAPH